MARRIRRNFDDWVVVLGDGLKATLAVLFAATAFIAALASGTISFGSNDDERWR